MVESRLQAKLDVLDGLDVTALAYQTGFIHRELRKLDLRILLKAWLGLMGVGRPTLERIVGAMSRLGHKKYTKQALSQLMAGDDGRFFSTVLMSLMWNDARQVVQQCRLPIPGRIWVQDSTVIALPDRYAVEFPGCVNQSSRTLSQLKLQCAFDLRTLELAQFSLSGYTRNDQSAAGDILAIAQPGDLVLRDLGYFVISVFETFLERSIHFLSRYRHNIAIYDPRNGQPLDLCRGLSRCTHLDIPIELGPRHVPVRLVAIPVPPEIANRRRRQAYRDRRAHPTKQSLFLMDWNIFITDLSAIVCPPKLIAEMYRVRWTVEIIFKAWKSCLHLEQLNTYSIGMLRFSVLTQLLLCVLTLDLCASLKSKVPTDRPPSPLRIAAIMADYSGILACFVFRCTPAHLFDSLLRAHGSYERRSDRRNSAIRFAAVLAKLG